MDTSHASSAEPPLGPRLELFTASRAQTYVGFVLGALLTAGGLGMAGCGLGQIPEVRKAVAPKDKELATGRLVAGLIVGGGMALFGVLGIYVARSLVGAGVEVCENGFRYWPPGPESESALWSKVERIEERYVYDKVPLRLGGPLLSETYCQLVVICRDGKRFVFDRSTIATIGRLRKRLHAVATERSITWDVIDKPD
jgi:hypothetical protein